MARTGIFGGTFNPFHSGHLLIAESFIEQCELDRLIIIPDKSPPHKDAGELASAEHRLEMCRRSVNDERMIVSDMEIEREEKSYTVITLEALKEKYPEDELYLMMGEDMFLTLLNWYKAERIIELAVPCVAIRSWDGKSRLEEYGETIRDHGGDFRILKVPFHDISSTEIRELVKTGKSILGLVPPPVEKYIRFNRLYL